MMKRQPSYKCGHVACRRDRVEAGDRILRGVFLVDSVVESEPGPSTSSTSTAAPSLDGANIQLPTVADELASLVSVNGDQVEIMAREKNMDEPELS